MKEEVKILLWESISGLFHHWGSDTPQEVLWNIPVLIKGINIQFDLNLPTEIGNTDDYGTDYFEELQESFENITTID